MTLENNEHSPQENNEHFKQTILFSQKKKKKEKEKKRKKKQTILKAYLDTKRLLSYIL